MLGLSVGDDVGDARCAPHISVNMTNQVTYLAYLNPTTRGNFELSFSLARLS
jgi:hypothetical protein